MEKYSHLALIPKNDGTYACYLPNIQTLTADFDLGELTANVETIVKDAFDDWAYQNCESPKAMADEEAIRETEKALEAEQIIPAGDVIYLIQPMPTLDERFVKFKVNLPASIATYVDERSEVLSVNKSAIFLQAILCLQDREREEESKAGQEPEEDVATDDHIDEPSA